MKSLSRLISVAGLAVFVLAAAPQSVAAQQLGNAVNTAKTVTDRAIGAVRGLAGGTPAAPPPAAAPRPAPAGAPPG